MVPAFAPVTKPFSINPESISKTPARTQRDSTARRTSHKIAQDSQSQIVGCSVHARRCAAKRNSTRHLGQRQVQLQQTNDHHAFMHKSCARNRICQMSGPNRCRQVLDCCGFASHPRENKSSRDSAGCPRFVGLLRMWVGDRGYSLIFMLRSVANCSSRLGFGGSVIAILE